MRALTWVILVALASGCVFAPRAAEPEPARDEPLVPNPETPPPRSRPTPPAAGEPGTSPEAPTPPAPPEEQPPEGAPTPPAAQETPPPEGETPPPFVVWPRGDDETPRPRRDVGFAPGLDGPDGTFILSWEQADDGLGFAAALASSADTRIHIDSLARLVSSASAARPVILQADPIDDPYVTQAILALWDEDGAQVGELDLLAAAPQLEATLPAGASYDLSWTLALAEGATEDVSVTVRLGVAS